MILEAPQVKLNRFEGPLDLLLYLIRQQEIDIHDIPISQIIRQYLSALGTMQDLNLEIAGEFILMVSYLLYIKAQMLLPRPQTDDDEVEDPRIPLVEKLLEYQKFKQIGEELKRYEIERSRFFPHGFDTSTLGFFDNLQIDVSSYDLYRLFVDAVRASPEALPRLISAPLIDIQERMDYIRAKLVPSGKMSFLELTEGLDKLYLVSTFIALLELVKQNVLKLKQARLFGKIIIMVDEDNDA